jgi:hypothetical protein
VTFDPIAESMVLIVTEGTVIRARPFFASASRTLRGKGETSLAERRKYVKGACDLLSIGACWLLATSPLLPRRGQVKR